jgi:cell division protein FtsL
VALLSRALPRSHSGPAPQLRPGLALLVAAIVIVAIGLLQIVQTSQATTTNFSIQRLEQEKLELQTSVSNLEAQVAALSSLSRIEREAKRLGLTTPAERRTVQVNVPWPGGEAMVPAGVLPARQDEAGEQTDSSEWWETLLKPLPFY